MEAARMTMVDDIKGKEPSIRKMITAEDVLARIGISRTTLLRLERGGTFPEGIPITANLKLWYEDEIVAWQRDSQDPTSALWQVLQQRKAAKINKGKRPPEGEPDGEQDGEEPSDG
jgi:predicted DNA-binding transcriptional regulator AlpA